MADQTKTAQLASTVVATPRDGILTNNSNTSTSDKEPKWETFAPFSFIANNSEVTKALKATKKTLKTTERMLIRLQTLIQSAKAVLNIISIFEKTVKNIIYTFLSQIINQLQTILNDVKSTGVYGLDLISYHWINNADLEAAINKDYNAIIAAGPWFANGTTEENSTKTVAAGNTILDILNAVDKSYKRETYYEFIETIVSAFQDINDVPSNEIAYAYAPASFGGTSYRDKNNNLKVTTTGHTNKVFGLDMPTILQSGRPDFGNEAYVKVYVIAFCVPDIGQTVNLILNLKLLLGDLITDAKQLDALKSIINITNNGNELITTGAKSLNKYLDSMDPALDKMRTELTKVNSTIRVQGKDPNFYGINLYTLFAPYFDKLQLLLNMCNSIINQETPGVGGLIDTLNSRLTDLEEQISRLLNIIETIENLIRLLEAILNITGLRILSFDTKEGLAGIVTGLRNAVDFGDTNSTYAALMETQRKNKATTNINNLKDEYDDYLNELADMQKRKTNMTAIKSIVQRWYNYVTLADLFNKQDALKEAEISWNNQILTQNKLKQDIIDTLNDIDGLAIQKTNLTTEWENANNGQTISGVFINGYTQTIAELVTARDALIAKHNDPTQPDINDYEGQLSSYNLQINAITQLQTDTHNTYDYNFNNLTWVQEAITEAPYTSQLITANQIFIDLKNDNNPDYSGSQAEIYKNNKISLNLDLTNLNNNITILNEEIVTVTTLKNNLHAQIYAYNNYAYMIDADDYPESGGLPTTPAPWDETAFTDLFTGTNGYWWCVRRLAEIPDDIADTNAAIAAKEIQITNNQTLWDNFSINNIMMQSRYNILKTILTNEISKQNITTVINNLIISQTADLSEKNEEINIIIEEGWSNYLSGCLIYYKESVPYSVDGVVIGDWTDNEIGYLILKDNYNYRNPLITNNLCLPIENALINIDGLIATAQRNVEVSKKAYDQAISDEKNREALYSNSTISNWKATDKYYYGGFLFCYGWPLDLDERTTKDIGTLYKESFQDPLLSQSELATELGSSSDIGKATGKLLNWIFK
jgi:hypothetical protein